MFDSISYLVYEDKVNVWGLLLYFTCECEDIPYDSLRKAESVLGLNHEKAHRDFNMAVTGSDNGIDWIDDNLEIYFQQSICRLSYLPKDALVDIYCVVTYYISETHNITHTINIANEKLYFIATKFNIDRIWFAQEAATRIGRYHGFIQEEETKDPIELFNIGYNYFYGREGFSIDLYKSFSYFMRSARMGISSAQYNVAHCYQEGTGVKQNYEKALYWYMKSAGSGDIDAMSNLGTYYYAGMGCDINYKMALYYWGKAASYGDAKANFNLGILYRDGVLGIPDYEMAELYFRKAKELGHERANIALYQVQSMSPL